MKRMAVFAATAAAALLLAMGCQSPTETSVGSGAARTAISTAGATKIAASSYTIMSGVQTEPCSEGGLDVGWIDAGDWMVYPITIPATGTYVIQYRVSSIYSGKYLSTDLNAGSIQLGQVAIPNTGNWQSYVTVNQTVTLNAGSYNFGINGGSGGFNISWFQFALSGGSPGNGSTGVNDPWAGQGTLIFDDEFNSSSVDTSKWNFQTGGGGWGNNELETYTAQNASIQNISGNSCLVITAKSDHTSARMTTQNHFSATYGKVEARIKLPYGKGMWPAFWMLGSNIGSVGWPACGETDIMEMIGGSGTSSSSGASLSDSVVYGTLHWLNQQTNAQADYQPEAYTLPSGKFSDDFHVFGVQWNAAGITYYIDGKATSATIPYNASMGNIFKSPFYLLLNLAIGGTWPGNPDGSTVYPQTMSVDWVRVWQ